MTTQINYEGAIVKEIFYDRTLRLWTMLITDHAGNALAPTDYTPDRKTARDWLREIPDVEFTRNRARVHGCYNKLA